MSNIASDNPIVEEILRLLHTELEPLKHSGDGSYGVGYADTRKPIEYDYHMPLGLQLAEMKYDPTISSQLEASLVDALLQRATVKDGTMEVRIIERTFFRPQIIQDIVPLEALTEGSVQKTQEHIYDTIASPLATLCSFDIPNPEIEQFRKVFGPFTSDEHNTKGDILIGCRPRREHQEKKWGFLWASVTRPKDLCDSYFRVLHTEETKNILAGNPRTILGIYIIMWALEEKHLTTFWPHNDCSGCPKFQRSHAAGESDDATNDHAKPLDADISPIPTTPSVVLEKEIERIIQLVAVYDQKYSIPTKAPRTVRQRTRPEPEQVPHVEKPNLRKRSKPAESETDSELETDNKFEQFLDYQHCLEIAVEKANSDLQLPVEIQKGLIRWVRNAAYMLIQVWSQMVRHNGTIARLTSYNLSVIMKRHRATGTLSVSNFLEYTDAPLLHATALTVYSYNDALARHDEHTSQGLPLWIKDPYRGQTEAERKEEIEAALVAESEALVAKNEAPVTERKTKKARKGPAPTSEDEADADKEEDDEEKEDKDDGNGNNDDGDADQSDNDEGSSGNNAGGRGGASGGGGRDHSGTGPGPSGGGGGGSGPNDGGRPRRSGRLNANRGASQLELDAVHLAFKAPEKHLWSTGFSHFTRLGPKAAPDITPVQEFPPVSFPATSRLGAFLPEYPSDQRRRVSGGSARSSASSASTRTSVPSLFSEPTSSAPTSPSTTSSFTHASSRGSSPFPEKASHDGGAHPPTSATSVCDAAGIIINAVLGESAIGTVWSGRLIPEDGSDDDYSIAIAVKMAIAQDNDEDGREDPRQAIRWETSVYDLLVKSGKQTISPQYYGAFEDRLGTVALVLDNAGTALQDFKAAKKPFRQALLAKAVEMHSVGIYHNDLVPRNIVQDSEGELRIIDFHIADVNHRCRGEDKCEELVAFRAALGL